MSPGFRRLLRLAERVLALAALWLIVFWLTLDLTPMCSGSMEPALRGSREMGIDWVLTEKVTRRFRDPRRFEIVAFQGEGGVKVLKRVIAFPGESLELVGGKPAVDGKPLALPPELDYLNYDAYGNLYPKLAPFRCTDGVYLLGDFTKDSQDSRFEGTLPLDRVLGRAWLIVWPPARFGFVR